LTLVRLPKPRSATTRNVAAVVGAERRRHFDVVGLAQGDPAHRGGDPAIAARPSREADRHPLVGAEEDVAVALGDANVEQVVALFERDSAMMPDERRLA